MFKISWDAGHGKETPGKRVPDDSMHEWEFNAAVVSYAMFELSVFENTIAQLRLDDPTGKRDVPLKERTNRLRDWGSQLHVSVHANASGDKWSNAEGIETFTYTNPDDVSAAFARVVQKKLIATTELKDRGVKQANFWMVNKKNTKCPSILVECGFMSNHKEAALLISEEYRKTVAHAIVSAIVEYFNLKKPAVKVAESKAVPWYGVELKKGQIGRITILKPINLWTRDGDKLVESRILQTGEIYRVYGYDNFHGGQYYVGGGYYITKMDGFIKYETPSKAMLDRVNK